MGWHWYNGSNKDNHYVTQRDLGSGYNQVKSKATSVFLDTPCSGFNYGLLSVRLSIGLSKSLSQAVTTSHWFNLFVHPVPGNNLQRPSIASRMVRLIEECCPGSFPKCHDLRKHAASLAWSEGLNPSDIIGAAFWSSSDVFIGHYLFVSQVPNRSCVTLNTI